MSHPISENSFNLDTSREKDSVLTNILNGYEDFMINTHGIIVCSNLEAVCVTGYEEWEVIGKHFSMFYREADIETNVPASDLEKVKLNSRVTFSAWRLKKKLITFWAQVTMSVVRDKMEMITGYRMVLRDNTHRLLSHNRLRKFRGEYLNLFNNPFIGIVKFKMTDYKFILINDKAIEVLGKTATPGYLTDIFASEDDKDYLIATLNEKKSIVGFEFRLRSDAQRWLRIDCRLFEEGFAEGTITDVTESRNHLIELEKTNQELDRFVYHASHDLRSPLTTLLGLINLVEVDKQIALADYCNMMRNRVIFLDELLKDMASIAFNGRNVLNVHLVDIPKMAERLKTDFEPGYQKLKISWYISDNHSIFTDVSRLELAVKKVLLNCANNFCSDTENPFININIQCNPDGLTMTITSNDKGIKDVQLLQIFGMFYKKDGSVGDTGLGLYIAKIMIDKLGGTISVKSKLGFGSEFTITIPNHA